MKRVCVFCGSRNGTRDQYVAAARRMGEALARRGIGLVYGGGGIGLMGILADAALSAGGDVIGVIPEALMAREVAHRGLTDLRVVASMHERKALMAELADAFVALPGGFGTLEEFCESLTWAQLGILRSTALALRSCGPRAVCQSRPPLARGCRGGSGAPAGRALTLGAARPRTLDGS